MSIELSENGLRESLTVVPVYGQVAVAARAGRFAERALRKDWLIKDLHTAAKTLLDLSELVAEEASWLSPGNPRPGGEPALDALVQFGKKAPRKSTGAAIYAIHQAACTAMEPFFAKDSGDQARFRLMEHAIPGILATTTALASAKGGHSQTKALIADIERICTDAKRNRWHDKTPVSRTYFGPLGGDGSKWFGIFGVGPTEGGRTVPYDSPPRFRLSDHINRFVIERLSWSRAVLLAATAADHAEKLFTWSQNRERVWLNDKERKIIGEAICAAKEIPLVSASSRQELDRAAIRAERAREVCDYEAETSEFDFDKVFWTRLGPLRYRKTTKFWQLSEGAYLLRFLRSEVAGAAHLAALAASRGHGGAYVECVENSVWHYEKALELFMRTGRVNNREGREELARSVRRFQKRYFRLMDLTQDHTVEKFLEEATNPADEAGDWRARLLGFDLQRFLSLVATLVWPAQVALATQCAERALQTYVGAGHLDERRELEETLRLADRVAQSPVTRIPDADWPGRLALGLFRGHYSPHALLVIDAVQAAGCVARRDAADEPNGSPNVQTVTAIFASAHALVLAEADASGIQAIASDCEAVFGLAGRESWSDETPIDRRAIFRSRPRDLRS